MSDMRDPLDILATIDPPPASPRARQDAMERAMTEFALAEKNAAPTQGRGWMVRLMSGAIGNWRRSMTTKSIAGPALATILLVPVAGAIAYQLVGENFGAKGISPDASPEPVLEGGKNGPQIGKDLAALENRKESWQPADDETAVDPAPAASPPAFAPGASLPATLQEMAQEAEAPAALVQPAPLARKPTRGLQFDMLANRSLVTRGPSPAPGLQSAIGMPAPVPDRVAPQAEGGDRVEDFETNPIRRVAEEPVSTFSIDVDTASYSHVRRSLKAGQMPEPDSVRVEELVNYFPYSWPAAETKDEPFQPTVTVMPSPWHEQKLLMHVAIKGFEMPAAQRPKTNLVFLVDTSGSMQAEDKLPLVKSSLRLLLDQLGPDDRISLVTYAGEAGVVLEPTPVSERRKIVDAIDAMGAGGSTAGAAGIEEAYQLAEKSFIEGGVNRIMLATDGDFNVGPSDDDSLKRLVEEKREKGVFLSILGFGRGNYNDQLMQVLAQNGNGVAAYIDTLAEAEKTLVQEASASLFTIARDVKIQVEFNPDRVSEYRLVGYETRALKREDFNNDRVDAGDIGSGHTVTAIYELTPVDSPAQSVDALRYQTNDARPAPATNTGEFAFLKIRYKSPEGGASKLMTRPVMEGNRLASLDQASEDVRFSIAVAGFGQKLRDSDATADHDWDRIVEIAQGARGADPFGYRSEFLTLLRLAKGLDQRQ